tara:strand:- start:23 stop:541 length:519 start_codon:yes stop_codon:yes gene_type:complete
MPYKDKVCCVYILFNVEGMYYIGQTTDLYHRLTQHRKNFRKNGHGSSKKLGAVWDCEILEKCAEEDLPVAERFYYDFYQEIDSEHCVNKHTPMQTPAEWAVKFHAENKDKCRENLQQWRSNNPDKYKAQKQHYYAENKDKLRENLKQWRIDNPEKYREQGRRAKAKRKALAI